MKKQDLSYYDKKGKANKLKPGDFVTLTREEIKWHVEHLSFSYSKISPEVTDGSREIELAELPLIRGWIEAWFDNKTIKGRVTNYGSNDCNPKTNKELKHKKVVGVLFKLPGVAVTQKCYFSERNLIKVSK